MRTHGADLGLAWDGDFDRCFFFDEQGNFIESYYIVGFLAQTLLARHPGAAVIHDPRLTWNTMEQVLAAGGRPIQCKTGHAFIKERMRLENALYGGEMSGHHYFRDFAYCDSGMIPWLLVLEMLSRSGRPLSALVAERMARFPVSGEINRRLPDPEAALRRVEDFYAPRRPHGGSHRRPQPGVSRLALQSAPLQHRAGTAPQRGNPAANRAPAAGKKTDEILAS